MYMCSHTKQKGKLARGCIVHMCPAAPGTICRDRKRKLSFRAAETQAGSPEVAETVKQMITRL